MGASSKNAFLQQAARGNQFTSNVESGVTPAAPSDSLSASVPASPPEVSVSCGAVDDILNSQGVLTGDEPLDVINGRYAEWVIEKGEDYVRQSLRQRRQEKRQKEIDKVNSSQQKAAEKLKLSEEEQEYDNRCQQYKSPLASKEADATLTATEKAEVLKAALLALTRIGYYDGATRHDLQVMYDEKSLNKAREFFESNPDITVSRLLAIINHCIRVSINNPAPADGGFDAYYIERFATKLHVLLKNLLKINSKLTGDDRLPPSVVFPDSGV